jgi:hypothetical protein
MAVLKKTTLELDHKFDRKSCRHYLNSYVTVFHCHHFTTLYTQLAMDAKETDLLMKVSEETFYRVLNDYFCKDNVKKLDEKIDIACQYYSALGLGRIEVMHMGEYSGEVISPSSHLDSGWIKKWGKYDRPVNYITSGYISALFASVLEYPPGTYKTCEVESIVMGAQKSVFRVVKS